MLLATIGLFQIIILIAIILCLIFPIVALVDILGNQFEGSNKLIWVLVVIFFPFLGSVIYFIVGRDQRISKL